MGWRDRRRKAKLLGLKRITVNGMRFTIRRVNPLMDFSAERVPQLFTEFQSARKPDPTRPPTAEQIKLMREQMLAYIQAGVVEPRLVPVGFGDKQGQEDGLTAEDLCRDPDMGVRLYWAILTNSLNAFRGARGVFFSIRQRLLLSILLRLGTMSSRWTSSPSPTPPPPTSGSASTSSSRASPPTRSSASWSDSSATPTAGGASGR